MPRRKATLPVPSARPRRRGRGRSIPGEAARRDLRLDPDFIAWRKQPGHGPGTVPEWIAYRWLERKMGYEGGRDFLYLSVIGGLRQLEGIQIDFRIHDWLAWAIQGVYWHYRTPQQREDNIADRIVAESRDLVYVELLDVDIIERPDATMGQAIRGLEMPGAREGRVA